MPAPGALAPDFTLPSHDGAPITLSSLRGRAVVLYFYPKDDTPGCTTEACDFRDALEQLAALGAVVVGVSGDTPKSHARFRDKHQIPFTLLSDASREVMHAYGVWQVKQQYGRSYEGVVRTTFLIDAGGVIRRVWDKVTVRRKRKDGSVGRHADDVRQALSELG